MPHRLLILADGQLGVFTAKTATCLLRYRADHVVGVLDREHAGGSTRELLGVARDFPIVGTLAEGLALAPDTLVIGVAPQGGQLPEEWREIIRGALTAGLSVLSGLHTFLGDDPELATLAARYGGRIVDFRKPPDGQPIASMRARETRALRVLTVGTDCNVGKMATSFELYAAARERGVDVRIAPTGQTGMMIAGHGITLDRIPGDFMAGWVEQLVLEHGDSEMVIVEGQGSLLHPAYSSVTLALLHGALPDAMVLVHHAGRDKIRYQEAVIPPLSDWVRRYEDAVAPLHPGKVVGIAINPTGLSPEGARVAIRQAEAETGLPAVDAVAQGAGCLVEASLRLRSD
jgi:uncharacterized NAD-dependent epimerase/dehydratase family protein